MSTDYTAQCLTCGQGTHLGQRFAGRQDIVFGYGLTDEEGRSDVGRFLLTHLQQGHDVRVVNAQQVGMEKEDPCTPWVVVDVDRQDLPARQPTAVRAVALAWGPVEAQNAVVVELRRLRDTSESYNYETSLAGGDSPRVVLAVKLPVPQFMQVEWSHRDGTWRPFF